MGQYYNVVIETDGTEEVYYHKVDGKCIGAKLMEHSYYYDNFVLAIASKLWRTKGRLAWVGDYANADDFNWNDSFVDAHKKDVVKNDLAYNGFRLEGKCFINHSKKMIIDLDKYKELLKDIDEVISPISLLTAVGNNKGCGDFHNGTGYELIGTWAWDVVEIIDKDIYEWVYDRDRQKWIKKNRNFLITYMLQKIICL